jgi:amino acid adenylation domain-containing protein
MTMAEDSAPGTVAIDYDPFADVPLARVVPATESQREIWLAASLEPAASLAYNESVTLHLDGVLDVAALRHALQGVIDRHEALRGSLSADGCQFLIAATAELACVEHDLSDLDAAARQAAVDAALSAAVGTPFDLEQSPMLRVELLRLAEQKHVLIISTHHIVCDGWSFGVIVRDLAALYAEACGSAPASLPPAGSFAEFALAEAMHPRSAEFHADEAYWLARNTPQPAPLDLPLDRPRPRRRGFASQRRDRILDAGLVAAVKRVGASRGASLYATLLATFGVLLHRLSGQDDLIVGIPAAGQSGGDHAALVGHAVNVLPLRLSLDPAQLFADTLLRVRGDLLDAFEHQRYTFGTLLRRLALARDPSRLPLVSVLFNLDPGLDDDSLGFDGLAARFAGVARSHENFELFINAVQVGGALRLECQYSSDLFDAATIERWLALYAILLQSVVDDPARALGALPMLPGQEQAALRALQPAPVACECRRIEELFFAQAERAPQRSAVQFGDLVWTYADLAQRVRSIATALRARGVVAGDLVGVCLPRGADMLASILGVLASGAGYVPLDPAFPRERLDFMASDAGLALLLTTADLVGSIDFPAGRTFAIDAPDAFGMPSGTQAPIGASDDTEAVAYVIYTSGSTGKPKGVRVPHRAVANFLSSMRRQPGLDADDRLLAVTTLSFDIAVLELFLPLSVGACVVLASREQVLDGRALAELIHACDITVMQATPSTWRMLLEAGWSGRCGLKALCGGESLPADLATILVERCDSLWNLYGPTETTVWSTCARIDDPAHGITIGQPIDNTTVWILDANGDLCPIGVPGEIAIGGAGVTLGYLDRPELSAERFIVDDESSDPQARLYRTGDRGRWRNDGRLEHLGRLDFQVKVRGFRIELGDIETNLARHADVAQAVVIVREDRPGDQRLVAYLVARPAGAIDEAELRAHLRLLLPEYMIPQHFMILDAIPLLPNGKLDRARLPTPQAIPGKSVEAAVSPRDDLERRVAAAMESALSLPGISVHDDFFALGGHSLLAAQLTAQLGREFGLSLSLGLIFEFPTVAGLAAALGQRLAAPAKERQQAIAPLEDPRRAPLSLLQKRLWLFEQLNPGTVVYNTPSAHRLRGPLDEAAFERAFAEMTRRQSILRTTIEREDGGEVIQHIHDVAPARLFPAEDLSAIDAGERERRLLERLDALTNVVIDLERLPLYRTHMFRLADDEHVFFFMPHHIIWDGWSFDLFYTEFAELYAAFSEGRESRLDPVPASYGEFSQWHTQWLQGAEYAEQFQRELAHWKDRLARTGAPPPLPTDRPRGSRMVGRGETEWISVPAEMTERVRALGRSADATLFMSLLAAYYALLWRLVGSGNLVVGTPVRVRASAEVENVMGLFTNLLPLPIEVDPQESFLSLVSRVKATARKGFASPEVQLEDLMREPGMRELAGATHFYQAQFSYQDARDRNCRWGGLQQEQVLIFQRAASEDLAIWFLEHASGMTGGVLYNADLFEADSARLFASRYLELLERVVTDPAQSIAELTAADANERERVAAFAGAEAMPASLMRLEQAFERRVDAAAAHPAMRVGTWATSAADLEQRANRIAACLRKRDVVEGNVVALCAERGVNRTAALLAILKLGAICLPLDPADPDEFLDASMRDAGATLLVGESVQLKRLSATQAGRLCFDADASEILGASAARFEQVEDRRDCVALVFPARNRDGVIASLALTHFELSQMLADVVARLSLREGDVLVSQAAPGRSLSEFACLLALCHGLEWIPAARTDVADAAALHAFVVKHQPRLLIAGANAWRELARQEGGDAIVAIGLCADDAPDDDLLAAMRALAGEIWLASGGTEALAFTAMDRAPAPESNRGFALRPLPWLRLRVLDESGALAPTGSAGRLWVGASSPFGASARADAVNTRPDPIDGVRLNATSLRARWLPDGRISIVSGAKPHAARLPHRAATADKAESATAIETMSFSERWLADLWQDLLGVPALQPGDNFFDLGGHSLLAMTLVAKVEDRTGVRLGILKVANSSLRALAADLSQEAIEEGARRSPSLRERALKLFGFNRGSSE